jgi:membrane protease YdiL (CAAX protease family)
MATWLATKIRNHRIASFFVLTYLLAWTLDAVPIVLEMDPSWTRWFIEGFLGPLSPAVAAALILYLSGDSIRGWLRDILRWRVHPGWYAFAILVPFGITYAAGVAAWLLGGPIDWAAFEFDPASIFIGIVLGTFLGGGQEELGWRGFAQPELQARYGGLTAALIIGVFWGLWHLPQFIIPGGMRADWPLALTASYFVGIIAFSILLAVVFNGSGGSAFLAMLMHGTDNSTQGRIPLDLDAVLRNGVINYEPLVSLYVSHAAITWLITLSLIAVTGTALYQHRANLRPLQRRLGAEQ